MLETRQSTTPSGTSSQPRCLVVMYHYIRHARTPSGEGIHAITPDELRAQLEKLITRYTPITWPDFVSWKAGRTQFSTDMALFTFDDGLKDHLRFAAPVLEEYGIQGIFFVPGIVLVEPTMLTAHAVHALVGKIGMKAFQQRLRERLVDLPRSMDLDESERRIATQIYHYEDIETASMKYLLNFKLSPGFRRELIEMMMQEEIGPSADLAREFYLNWEDLIRLQARGHTIGGHGFSHDPYSQLSHGDRDRDLRQSADVLEEGLGPGSRPFSYPFGQVDDETADVCRRAGFHHGFTTRREWAAANAPDMLIPRVDTIHVDAFLEESTSCSRR